MNTRIELSERQQVIATFLMAAVVIFVLWVFLLLPLNHRRRQMEREVQTMTTQLAQNNYLLGEAPLRNQKMKEETRYQEYCNQIKQTFSRLSMFPEESEWTNDVGHIDFKVAIFAVRQRLRQKSRSLGISLPYDLGMDDSVNSNEDARKLMLQLRAVEEITDLALNLRIRMIKNIEPMAPVQYTAGTRGTQFLEEYPVRVRFYGTSNNVYDLLQAVLEPDHIFVFRNLRVERASPQQPELVDVNAVLSALVFREYSDEVAMVSAPSRIPASPMGY